MGIARISILPPQGLQRGYSLGGRFRTIQTVDFTSATWNTVGTHELFTVTGLCQVATAYFIPTSLTSAGAPTLSFGIEGATTAYNTAQLHTVYSTLNHVRSGALSPASTVQWGELTTTAQSALNGGLMILNGPDIGYEILIAAMTGGAIDAYCFWTPLESGASVVLGAGGAL